MKLPGRYIGFAFFWILIPGLATSCSEKQQDHNGRARESRPVKQIIKPPSGYSDTLRIETAAAVFYQADSSQFEIMKKEFDKDAIENMNHECFYQARNARESIRKNWPGIRIVNALGVRYLEFVKSNGTRRVIDLETKRDLCGVLLFNRDQEPLPADMMNIETDLGFYFNP